jgi:uncharacterized protein involved in outer membrane biogenesis
MKPPVKLLVIAVSALVGVMVAKNLVAKAAVTSGVKLITGLPLGIRSMDVGILNTAVGIRGLRLHHPSGFPDKVMVDMPEIFVDYDLGAFLRGKVHLEEVRLDLKEFMVVKDAQGRLNLDSLRVVQESKAQQQGKPSAKAGKAPQIRIDELRLKVGTVIYKDYSGGGAPRVQEFAVNIDQHYQGITNPYALGGIIVSQTLAKTTIARLTGFDVGPLQSMVSQQLEQARQAVGQAAKQFKASTADSLKKVLPFGN